MTDWDPRHRHTMLKADFDALVRAAEAEKRGTPPIPLSTAPIAPGTTPTAREVLSAVLELLQEGEIDQAMEHLRAFLEQTAAPEGEQAVMKSLMSLNARSKSSVGRLQWAFHELERGAANLAATRERLAKDKLLLRVIESAVRARP